MVKEKISAGSLTEPPLIDWDGKKDVLVLNPFMVEDLGVHASPEKELKKMWAGGSRGEY